MEALHDTYLHVHPTAFAPIAANYTHHFLDNFNITPQNQLPKRHQQQEPDNPSHDHDDDDDDDDDEDDFSFASAFALGSPVSADDIFHNGQILPIFPLFNRDLLFADDGGSAESLRPPLKKVFVEERSHSSEEGEPEGPHCAWTPKVSEATAETCKKSNSTGFSKLWRFRELVQRSGSDGKDAFVLLHHRSSNDDGGGERKGEKKKAKKKKDETTPSFCAQYAKNRAAMKESEKRRSYLPYRVGFFTNVNGLSRNIHPF